MNENKLKIYIEKFKKHINQDVKFFIGTDELTNKQIFAYYKILKLNGGSKIKVGDEKFDYDQYVVLSNIGTNEEIKKSIKTIVDYMESLKPNKFLEI